MQRLWLTPLFRVTMRVGLPAFVVVLAAGIYLSDADRRAAFGKSYADLKTSVEQRPEFMVGLLAIDGASPALTDAVRAKVDQRLPISRFDLDLDGLQAKAESLDAVASALVAGRCRGRPADHDHRTRAGLCLALGCRADDDRRRRATGSPGLPTAPTAPICR